MGSLAGLVIISYILSEEVQSFYELINVVKFSTHNTTLLHF